ncbi:MAG: EutN/CcmL family microcompartment protein [Chloroflexi bacterium]|nr:EutN/CcmL family microcompartment protein [Chloroflexota bacterium]
MFLGRVVGTVWATRKDEKLDGLKFQIVKKVDDQELTTMAWRERLDGDYSLWKNDDFSEPDGKGSMIYVVVPVKGRAAAKKLYIQQRKADDSPKADIVPASKLEEKRAARTRRSTKAA